MPKLSLPLCLFMAMLCIPRSDGGQGPPTTLRVEVVDDSDQPFSPYILLVGQAAAGTGTITYPLSVDPAFGQLAVANAGQATNNVTPLTVDLMQLDNYTVVSRYTGKVRQVRFFNVTTIGTGVLMIFKNDGSGSPPFVYVNNANPSTITSNYRFDLCELTFNANIQSDADLTSIDSFSMPMQFELFNGLATSTSTPIDGRYYYLSTPSILAAFQNLGAGQTLYKIGPGGTPVPGWSPADGMDKFVRALGPGQVATTNVKGDPSPYPSFASYLQGLSTLSGKTFYFNGNANGSDYAYSGTVTSDGHGGYQMVLSGTTTPSPPTPVPDGAPVTIYLPVSKQATAAAAVDNTTGQVTGVSVQINGSGYNNPPIVTIAGPPPAQLGTATASLSGDAVGGVQLQIQGSNYFSAPQITFDPPQTGNDVALATATVSGGIITGLSLTHGGSGYSTTPQVTIAAPPQVATATATAQVTGGQVTSITINPAGGGAGYLSPPVVTVNPAGSMDTFLYGATLSADAFSVQGISYAALQSNTNIVYGSIARDALAAINFGYLNGQYGDSSLTWYGAAPTAFPFGLARPTNDGFYNPWAALFYNFSDAYSFAFSDRSGPSPDMLLQAGQTLRITILPDNRLDSPRPYVTQANPNSLDIEWPEVAGASSYLITVLAPSGVTPQTIAATPEINRLKLENLASGTPYTFTVAAQATAANGNPLQSPAQPVQCSTTGSASASTGSISFDLNLSWIPPSPITNSGAPTVTFNNATPGTTLTYQTSGGTAGQWLNNGLNALCTGTDGSTQYVMTINDASGGLIYTNVLTIQLSGTSSSYTVPSATLFGNEIGLAPTGSFSSSSPAVIGVAFAPTPLKAFAPSIFPGMTYAEWVQDNPELGSASDPMDDPDSDGLTNLQEYFQSTDPTVPGLFESTWTEQNANQLVFHYRKSAAIVGVTEQLEWSTDLQNWQTSGVTYDPERINGDHLECAARVSSAESEKMFVRLQITMSQSRPSRGKLPFHVIPRAAKPMGRRPAQSGGTVNVGGVSR